MDSPEQLAVALRVAPPPLIIEEYIVGDEHSFEGVLAGGKLVWHSFQVKPMEPGGETSRRNFL